MNSDQTKSLKKSDTNQESDIQYNELIEAIWSVTDNLKKYYLPLEYHKIIIPMTLLLRFDAILSPHTHLMASIHKEQMALPLSERLNEESLGKLMVNQSGMKRQEPLYNRSGLNLELILDLGQGQMLGNITKYILDYSANVKDALYQFEFLEEIKKLDRANVLFKIFDDTYKQLNNASLDVTLGSLSNQQMSNIFESLLWRCNAQIEKEAEEHATPRDVTNLMVNLLFAEDKDKLKKNDIRPTIYDPMAGTGGFLVACKKYLNKYHKQIDMEIYGQEINAKAYATCCAYLLINDESTANIVYGNTLGGDTSENNKINYLPYDGHQNKHFNYMLADPLYGHRLPDPYLPNSYGDRLKYKHLKRISSHLQQEAETLGFNGRFGAGVPDGLVGVDEPAIVFLQHMISKMQTSTENGEYGSRIAIIMPNFTIARFPPNKDCVKNNINNWIIENDWLEAIITLPTEVFYDSDGSHYIWILSNKKTAKRRGKIQLIDARAHYQTMRTNFGKKYVEFSSEHIADLTQLYSDFIHDGTSQIVTGQ